MAMNNWRSRDEDLRELERQLTEAEADPRVCPACAFSKLRYGPCENWPGKVHQGGIIVVPKGAKCETFAPRGVFTAGRTYRVKVNHFIGNIPRWPGESGYWTWTQDWRPIDGFKK